MGESSEITLNFVFDEYPDEVSWNIYDEDLGRSIRKKSDYRYEYVNGVANETIELCNDHCYKITIHDLARDGLCCKFGNGGYEIVVKNEVAKKGTHYSDLFTEEFCLDLGGDFVAPSDVPSMVPSFSPSFVPSMSPSTCAESMSPSKMMSPSPSMMFCEDSEDWCSFKKEGEEEERYMDCDK